ncbi:MAG: response regulator [Anaerolineales bacterium]|nr:response regulator [Anaerolineales bacterium]
MKRILLADADSNLRSALGLILETRLEAQIVGQATSMPELLQMMPQLQPDLVLMDWELSGKPLSPVGRVQTVRQMAPQVKVLIASIRPEVAALINAADADGFINKSDLPEAILAAFRLALTHHV